MRYFMILLFFFIFTGCLSKENNNFALPEKSPGDRDGHVMKDLVPNSLIPDSPFLPAKKALESFQIDDDFTLDIIASDTLLHNPIAAKYDPAGRLWVMEMRSFMQDANATGEMEKVNQLVVLIDKDQDGIMDKRKVVLDDLILPRGFAFVDKGILWADHTSLFFSEIEEGRHQPYVKKTDLIDASYAKGGNVEHKPNGLLFSLDNWYYDAKSDKRHRVLPLDRKTPLGSKEIYRNEYWKLVQSKTEFRGQWGISQDDWGRHYFMGNSSPLFTSSYLPSALTRNAKYNPKKAISEKKLGANKVYPARVNPGVNRAYLENILREDHKLHRFTAACGVTLYRGDQFPPQFYNTVFIAEPAGNLVRATQLMEENGVVTGKNMYPQREIIASFDERFRPVNFVNAPDGTIHMLDMYHGIVQHRTYLTSYLTRQIKSRDLENNKKSGRIYRIRYKKKPLPQRELLAGKSSAELVLCLTHSNGWHRDTAQQMLVMRQDKSVIPLLKIFATQTLDERAQVKALWILEGLAAIDLDTLKMASRHAGAKAKRSIYRIAETLPLSEKPAIQAWVESEWETVQGETAPSFTLLATTFRHWPVLIGLVEKFGVTGFMISGLGGKEKAFLAYAKNKLTKKQRDILSKIANKKSDKKKLTLDQTAMESYRRGKQLYSGSLACFGCHGADGEGTELVPSLNKSAWVTGDDDRLVKVLLHGLSGPITVNGKSFKGEVVMPGLGNNKNVSDEDIADVITYIRNTWGNRQKSKQLTVTAEDVADIREKTRTRKDVYKTSEFELVN